MHRNRNGSNHITGNESAQFVVLVFGQSPRHSWHWIVAVVYWASVNNNLLINLYFSHKTNFKLVRAYCGYKSYKYCEHAYEHIKLTMTSEDVVFFGRLCWSVRGRFNSPFNHPLLQIPVSVNIVWFWICSKQSLSQKA